MSGKVYATAYSRHPGKHNSMHLTRLAQKHLLQRLLLLLCVLCLLFLNMAQLHGAHQAGERLALPRTRSTRS